LGKNVIYHGTEEIISVQIGSSVKIQDSTNLLGCDLKEVVTQLQTRSKESLRIIFRLLYCGFNNDDRCENLIGALPYPPLKGCQGFDLDSEQTIMIFQIFECQTNQDYIKLYLNEYCMDNFKLSPLYSLTLSATLGTSQQL
jgi:hypothetical protein